MYGGDDAMRIRLLGPVELRGHRGRVDLGTPQQRCVFAVLATAPGEAVSVDALLDRVWGEQPPAHARTVLYTYVSRLRAALAYAVGGGGSGRALLRRRDGGYALEVHPEVVDLHRARRLASQARGLFGAGADEEARAAALLAQACQHWSGTPLAGLAGDWADRVRIGLDHERLALLIERFEVGLRVGEHTRLVGPLSEALAAYPLTESLAELLMLALHRAGRSAEALDVYAQLRGRMVQELGDEPGGRVRTLHEQLLRRDPALDAPPQSPRTPQAQPSVAAGGVDEAAAPWAPLCQLPPDHLPFVGRDAPVKELAAALEPDGARTAASVVTVDGPPGVGKTALATHVAHQVRDRYPDGQWFVTLRGCEDQPREPAEVLAELLAASGTPPASVPPGRAARAAALRARLADRRVLLVLDDAADTAQVRPLLPGTGSAAVVVTSTRRLGTLGARAAVRLTPLADTAALELLGQLSDPQRVAAEPDAAAAIVSACGCLPLALRVAADRLRAHPEWTLRRFADRLADPRQRLDELASDDLTVREALAGSFRELTAPAQAALQQLTRLGTRSFTSGTAAALAGLADGDRVVDELVAANLLDPVDSRPETTPHYRLPELVAVYTAELADRCPQTKPRAPEAAPGASPGRAR